MTKPQSPRPKIEILKELFEYNPETGILIWKKSYFKSRNGKHAGGLDAKNKCRVGIGDKVIPAHHVCFAMYHGFWPKDQIDHINRDRLDNRICNLREATNAQNIRNRMNSKPPKSGYKGVSLHKGRYIALIMKDGVLYNLGSFGEPLAAAAAYNEAAIKLHGEFACLN